MHDKIKPQLSFRKEVEKKDVVHVRDIVKATGFFNKAEIDMAVELINARLAGDSSYNFIFAEHNQTVVGYVCYGAIVGTTASYDLYWLAVLPSSQGSGVGSKLIRACETAVFKRGGRRIYVETSSRQQYQPTRAFYQKNGYTLEAQLADFYAENDAKCIYVKILKEKGFQNA